GERALLAGAPATTANRVPSPGGTTIARRPAAPTPGQSCRHPPRSPARAILDEPGADGGGMLAGGFPGRLQISARHPHPGVQGAAANEADGIIAEARVRIRHADDLLKQSEERRAGEKQGGADS